ncbi:antibiotic biosynthesis monooxygenase family protein [Streptomyces antimicrobicus]|uniref:Antibiotic biosynthesis monooxygenase n=1 Tax=Streptomyces antimicrobicus TaxID=2883108 RepID=A0ABS8B1U6_9ACTN|nr:antibiotic biosynthesis monooxygenase family protein [Streptomyces antimicrobicus]MCB5178565.1 antibiotic biosynthesis monooxygenase [Streptomyces antimicrobicus]
MVTFVNKLTVHGDIEEFLAAKERISAFMSAQPGHIAHRTLNSLGEPNVFVEIAEWVDAASHRAAMTSETFRELVGPLAALATPEPGLFRTVEEGPWRTPAAVVPEPAHAA